MNQALRLLNISIRLENLATREKDRNRARAYPVLSRLATRRACQLLYPV